MSRPILSSLNWAVYGKLASSVFFIISGGSSMYFLAPSELGTYLMVLNLLALFQVSDFGSIGFLTVKSREMELSFPDIRTIVFLSNGIASLIFALGIGLVGGILFFRQVSNSPVLPSWTWLLILVCHLVWQWVIPLIAFMDGTGKHKEAWRTIFFLELLAGVGMALPLFFRNAFLSLLFFSLAKALMAPFVIWIARAEPTRKQQAGLRSARPFSERWSSWKKWALPSQAAFFWVNITWFATMRAIHPLVFYFQGSSRSAVVSISFIAATVAFNLSLAWPTGAMGRLAMAYTVRDIGNFNYIFSYIKVRSWVSFAGLFACAIGLLEMLRNFGPPALSVKVPPTLTYVPILIGHFAMLISTCYAVAIRTTGKDDSAVPVGIFGILSIPVYAWAAWAWQSLLLPSIFMFVSVGVAGIFVYYWRRRSLSLPPAVQG